MVFQARTSVFDRDNVQAVHDLVDQLHANPDVGRVEGFAAFDRALSFDQAFALVQLQRQASSNGIGSRFAHFANDRTAMILVYAKSYPNSPASKDLLDQIGTSRSAAI